VDWDRLRIFFKIAEIGSFSKAAEVLYVSQSALSRQVALLEKELNCLLFYRIPRGLKLTHKGELLHKTVQEITVQLASTEMMLIENKDAPRGVVRVAITHVLGVHWLSEQLLEFSRRYPEIHFQLTFADCEVNLASKQYDISITLSPSSDPDFVTSNPLPSPSGIFGSKVYLEKRGSPTCIEDLDKHRLMIFQEKRSDHSFLAHFRWLLEVGRSPQKPRSHVLALNSFQGLSYAAQKGLGLVQLPKFFVSPQDGLVEVLQAEVKPLVFRYVACTRQSLSLKRVFIFRQYILQKLDAFF
jgi:DNA-binding transcriptional LysR family regulator